MSIIGSNILAGASGQGAAGYQIDRSVRLNPADTAFFSKTFGSAGNRKTYTLSAWIKLCSVSTNQYYLMASGNTYFCFTSTGQIEVNLRSGSTNYFSTSNQVFRDFSAWQHIVWVVNTVSSAMEAYVNGVRITWSSRNVPANTDTDINRAAAHNLGKSTLDPRYFDGYLAEVRFLDGLTPGTTTREVGGVTQTILTDFGEFDDNGVWQPIEYTGSYPGNSFYLDFADNSSTTSGSNVGIGKDVSGNGNYWDSTNLSVTAGAGNDSLRDSPTNGNTASDTGAGGEVPGNYCTWNPLVVTTNNSLTNGNLEAAHTAGTGWSGNTRGTQYAMHVGSMGVTSGKYYWEGAFTSGTTGNVGIVNNAQGGRFWVGYPDANTKSVGYVSTYVYNNGFGSDVGSMPSYGINDIIGVAIDMDNGKLYFSVNGTFINSGDPIAGTGYVGSGLTGETIFPAVTQSSSADGYTFVANFGQRAFAYSAPSGYKALCTANLDDPTIADGSTAMDALLYTGTGSQQTISGLNFEPDLVWTKGRSIAELHLMSDRVRGVPGNLYPNLTNAEDSNSYLSALTTDGFTVQSAGIVNSNTSTYVAWCWDGGSSTVSNTDGSITSSVRANASAGFSIVTYTSSSSSAQTVGHGLNAAPHLVIVKNRDTSGDPWAVYTKVTGKDKYLFLNTTDYANTLSGYWGSAEPTSTVFGISIGDLSNNRGTDAMVAYCFAPVEGYSAFGSYTGNGSADGPFIYTGMKVKWLMVKRTDSAEPWWMWDIPRSTATPGNPMDALLRANGSDQEYAPDTAVDSLSNGFKPRSSSSNVNASGGTYVWAAFAENPFSIARAR